MIVLPSYYDDRRGTEIVFLIRAAERERDYWERRELAVIRRIFLTEHPYDQIPYGVHAAQMAEVYQERIDFLKAECRSTS